jgi:ribose-phosphate pyrophosphokinase
MLFSGRGLPELADEVAGHLGITVTPEDIYEFANGEIFVRYKESARGSDAFVIQSCGEGINTWVMETLIMIDALKRASAKRITVVLPFYPYARQDKKHRGREPISARLMADLLMTAGAHRLMCVDLHTDQIQGFFDGPVDHLMAAPLLTEYILRQYGGDPLKPNQVVANRVVGEVDGRTCIVVDDMIDTGGTIASAAREVLAAGAAKVIVAATHGVLSDPAAERLSNCGLTEVVLTNTLPIPENHRFPKLTVLSIAPLLAKAIHEVFEDGSVTSLFES